MSNGNERHLRVKVQALQHNLEGLLKLLGGTPDERERFWEIIKGITTPAVFKVIETHLDGAALQLQSITQSVKTLEANAKELSQQH